MSRIGRAAIIAGHGVVGWAFCGAIMAIGPQVTSMDRTLILHAIGAPIGFALISWFYHRNYGFTTPLQTAGLFLLIVVALDVVVVALLIEKSFAMFQSPLGTWVPLTFGFLATYITGLLTQRTERAERQ